MLEVGAAMGWMTTYPVGRQHGSTAFILRDRDSLTTRSMSTDAVTTKYNIRQVIAGLVPSVVGD